MKKLIDKIEKRNREERSPFPDKFLADKFIADLFELLYVRTLKSKSGLRKEFRESEELFIKILSSGGAGKKQAKKISAIFFEKLEELYHDTMLDAKAILNFDPAARSLEEVLHVYPGFYAIAIHRISHYLWIQGLTAIARLFSEKAHCKTGIDIHPGARIGKGFAIDHGTGIVIGETTRIGDRVKIYQGVTLGALTVSKDHASSKRHPTIEDDVVIYSNATILGGQTVIGRGSTIGGNVWLVSSVPANSLVFHQSEIRIKSNNPGSDPINFYI